MACSLLVTVVLNRWQPFAGNSSLVFAKGALATTVVTTIVWVTVTLLTKPEPDQVLLSFYRHVRPDVRGWKRVASQAPELAEHRDLKANLLAWAIGCAMIYLCLFGTGKLLLREFAVGWCLLAGSAVCAVLLYRGVVRNFAIESE
jgi:solute:Na+ symporter, SSS family